LPQPKPAGHPAESEPSRENCSSSADNIHPNKLDLYQMRFGTAFKLLVCIYAFVFLNGFIGLPIHPATVEPDDEELLSRKRFIYRIKPEKRGGEAFKLIYLVPVPVDVFWKFKTDFHGTFLVSNRYIKKHRFILQVGNDTITENMYSNVPNETFRWRTTVYPGHYRLDFQLENPRECGQKFHYGTIKLEPFRSFTKVTHVAYFDFFGASLWVNLPFRGGMSSFLIYTAQWEIETISRLQEQYAIQPVK
jgi:hypothetical protein